MQSRVRASLEGYGVVAWVICISLMFFWPEPAVSSTSIEDSSTTGMGIVGVLILGLLASQGVTAILWTVESVRAKSYLVLALLWGPILVSGVTAISQGHSFGLKAIMLIAIMTTVALLVTYAFSLIGYKKTAPAS